MRYLFTFLFLIVYLTNCGSKAGSKQHAQVTSNQDTATSRHAASNSVSPNSSQSKGDSISIPYATEKDKILVERILQTAVANQQRWGKENTILWIARQFIGVPYVAHTLDRTDKEQMVINLHELDCTTYVEAVLSLSQCAFNGQTSFPDYCKMAQRVRYRDGKVAYENRLHYFQWWVADNENKGLIKEIATPPAAFSGKQQLRIDYMTTHAADYAMLRQAPNRVKALAQQEKEWEGKTVSYIPKAKLNDSSLWGIVQDGDIIGLVTNKTGLDASHLGIAVWHKDGLYLLNASSLKKNGKQVVEPTETLYQYLSQRKHNTGIRVLRIQNKN